MARLPVPSRFKQHYQIEEYLASGQCGDVYKASYKDNSHVALKVFTRDTTSAVFGYFSNEQLLLREIKEHRQHQHIVEYVTSYLVQRPFFLVTRFVEGARPLEDLLGKPLNAGFVARVIEQTADALDYLHNDLPGYSPVIHRDVKPNNLLIDIAGNTVLIDLSIARWTGFAITDEPGLGTLSYMPPEQHLGAEVPATDQFALAIVALQMLTGHVLLPNHRVRAEKKLETLKSSQYAEVHKLLGPRQHTAKVIIQALAFEPEHRFASCKEFARCLREALIADRQSLANTDPPPPKRSYAFMGYVAMGACGILALIALIWVLVQPSSSTPQVIAGDVKPATSTILNPASSGAAQPSFRPPSIDGPAPVAPTSALVDIPTPIPPTVPPVSQPTTGANPGAGVVQIMAASEPLRKTPSTQALVVSRMPRGTRVAMTGRTSPQGVFVWYQVIFKGQTGWCRSLYCKPQ